MIFRRVLFAFIAISAFSAASAVTVVAIAFALYALVEPHLGRAGAAAVLALTTALLMALAGGVMALAGRRKRAPVVAEPEGLVERAMWFVRQKPAVSIAAAIGAGLLAVRNPAYLGSVMRSFLDGKPPKR